MYFRIFLCSMGGKEPLKTYRFLILRALSLPLFF